MMNKTRFYKSCPKTRAEFLKKWEMDFRFRNSAKVQGFAVVGGNILLPNGMVANSKVKWPQKSKVKKALLFYMSGSLRTIANRIFHYTTALVFCQEKICTKIKQNFSQNLCIFKEKRCWRLLLFEVYLIYQKKRGKYHWTKELITKLF